MLVSLKVSRHLSLKRIGRCTHNSSSSLQKFVNWCHTAKKWRTHLEPALMGTEAFACGTVCGTALLSDFPPRVARMPPPRALRRTPRARCSFLMARPRIVLYFRVYQYSCNACKDSERTRSL
ncbi:hypothetical protein P691DRAFT_96051 [Macrolepiota fuliginosa MF-IS2]|uniref:Uncharacterized protein n=1 Tax=Macrolepiota fuliginosa MF-IS2 TaxID=1400762 RepID=A0A9P5XE91_9AGAR|nr:hypothetical protein P691DRAFT_96051 [Macrolepiota fuliginosa MF-IS2]